MIPTSSTCEYSPTALTFGFLSIPIASRPFGTPKPASRSSCAAVVRTSVLPQVTGHSPSFPGAEAPLHYAPEHPTSHYPAENGQPTLPSKHGSSLDASPSFMYSPQAPTQKLHALASRRHSCSSSLSTALGTENDAYPGRISRYCFDTGVMRDFPVPSPDTSPCVSKGTHSYGPPVASDGYSKNNYLRPISMELSTTTSQHQFQSVHHPLGKSYTRSPTPSPGSLNNFHVRIVAHHSGALANLFVFIKYIAEHPSDLSSYECGSTPAFPLHAFNQLSHFTPPSEYPGFCYQTYTRH
jgi:hypothetical protein